MTARSTPLEQETFFPSSASWWRRYPVYGFLALVTNIVTWFVAWSHIEPVSHYTFFPFWLSFIIVLDALNKARMGTSLMTGTPAKFVQLFLFSIVFWWLFEALNAPTQNWHYLVDHWYDPLSYNLIASLDFSTALPAVLELATFWASFSALRPCLPATESGLRISVRVAIWLVLLGGACAVLPLLFPHQTFPLLWLSVILVLDPLNNLMGRKSALAHFKAKDWRFFVALPLAGITCGFFWELWNYFSLPKWYYTVPYVGLAKVFEMPLLGYTGYLPFVVELFALYQFLLAVLGQRNDALSI